MTGVRCHGKAITAGGRARGADGGIRDDFTSDNSRPVAVVVVRGSDGRRVAVLRLSRRLTVEESPSYVQGVAVLRLSRRLTADESPSYVRGIADLRLSRRLTVEESPSYVDWSEFHRPLDEPTAANKRKWGNNKARMWGKRDDDNENRKWAQKSSRLWGKRLDMDDLAQLLQGEANIVHERAAELQDKRKWAKNKARMWGK